MDRDKAIHEARKQVKIAKFERECRCTYESNRRKKAYKVPGTTEAGKHAMLSRRVFDIADRLTAA